MLLWCFLAVNFAVALLCAYFLSPLNVTVTLYAPPVRFFIVMLFAPFLRYICVMLLLIFSVASPATSPFGVSVIVSVSVSPALMSDALIVRFVSYFLTLNIAVAVDDS